ncbi:ferric reductase-like transmembrane domain-containing protein [Marinobacter sp.]|uniref:ferric reductase-like transmembrane domain-containing protein n=1 Tax=Marinobacter sp. TaxID=50741 RepID=UPI003A8FAC1F
MIKLLFPFIVIVTGLWAWALARDSGGSLAWLVYEQSLYLTGLLAISLMSLAVILALRPAWMVRALGGRSEMYRSHKWAGILTGIFAAIHWLIEMGDDVFEWIFGQAEALGQRNYSGFIELMRDAAEEVGEFTIYLLLAMLLISLLRKFFPFKLWRNLHRTMPVLYLLLVFHAVWMAPLQWWQQPIGFVMATLLAGGSVASFISLKRLIGPLFRPVSGKNLNIHLTDSTGDVR